MSLTHTIHASVHVCNDVHIKTASDCISYCCFDLVLCIMCVGRVSMQQFRNGVEDVWWRNFTMYFRFFDKYYGIVISQGADDITMSVFVTKINGNVYYYNIESENQ